ncbi:hypothetical protein AS850_03345 [Frondihabitans sp. 762G35]|uniref:hypothetical protein n=1 Tax=Frondihabitans sp. 762G35 TaxID=1446794 RepID=UPI000D20731A|nr:hypothetical protein [Frondihabitans sp. 762G35]ARC56109.1 hypothetical protein AS850_03345 [Frondihabitans sp. 762G35]
MMVSEPRIGIDRTVALVGGGALAVGVLLGWRPPGLVPGLGLVAGLLFPLGLAVLAFGLPGRPGAFGHSRVVRASIGAAAALTAVGVLLGLSLTSVDSALAVGTPATDALWMILNELPTVLLVVAAVAVRRSEGATRDAQRGLAVLAVASVAVQLLGLVVALLGSALPNDEFQTLASQLFIVFDVLQAVTLAVGLWFAWPFLGPLLHRFVAFVTRVRRAHVDSTP